MSRRKLSKKARQVFAEYLIRVQDGENVDFEELCKSHASIQTELEELHKVWADTAGQSKAPSVTPDFTIRMQEMYGEKTDPGVVLPAQDSALVEGAQLQRLKQLQSSGALGTRYVFVSEIARGGMGVILHVWDTVLRRSLAMKVIHSPKAAPAANDGAQSSQDLARFLEEAQVTGQLDHPGVVSIHDLGIDANGQVYFTMPLIEGQDLGAIFELVREEREAWTLTRAVSVLMQVCEIVAYAHSRGVIHRDLKPANVMVGKFGETYVMDWGLAKVAGREDLSEVRRRLIIDPKLEGSDPSASPLVTVAGTVVGTPVYMPPEQAEGQLDRIGTHSDVYCLGAILYELLAGQAPYVKPGTPLAPRSILQMVKNGPPPPIRSLRATVPAELEAICNKAMARDPEDRYTQVGDMANDLRAFLEGRVVVAYESGFFAEIKKLLMRNKGISLVILLCFLMITGACLFLIYTE